MTKEEFLENIEELKKENTKESNEKIIELLKDGKKYGLDDKKIELITLNANINILITEINSLGESDTKEVINLRGKLIELYKIGERITKGEVLENKYRYEKVQELKRQKESISAYKHDKKSKVSIPENVALTVKDISNTIQIFLNEKDFITKYKKIINETIKGSVSSLTITAIMCAALYKIAAVPVLIETLPAMLPVVGYIGLSSIIRNMVTKTPYQQYAYQNSDKYKKEVDDFMSAHEEEIKKISYLVEQKKDCNPSEKIEMNEMLIEKFDSLAESTKIQGIKNTFGLQSLGLLRENKMICEQIKDDYLDEKNDDRELYIANNKKLRNINFEIFSRENSINDSIKFTGKNIAKNMAVISVARLLMSVIAPETFPMTGVKDLIVPFAFTLASGIQNIPNYTAKLKYKETDYQGQINIKNKKRIEELLELKTENVKYA